MGALDAGGEHGLLRQPAAEAQRPGRRLAPVDGPEADAALAGLNYPGTKNLQEQSYGFGAFRQKFQTRDGKSAYGVPIFDSKGNVNPAYLAKERAEMAKKSKNNVKNLAKRRNEMISKGTYYQSSYVEKK